MVLVFEQTHIHVQESRADAVCEIRAPRRTTDALASFTSVIHRVLVHLLSSIPPICHPRSQITSLSPGAQAQDRFPTMHLISHLSALCCRELGVKSEKHLNLSLS